jgi:competence protein ComGF
MRKKAFLLADAVFSIFITSLCILTLNNLLLSLKTAQKARVHNNEIVFSYVQFNNFLKDSKKAYVKPAASDFRHAVFVKENQRGQKKTYRIEQYQDMVRVTTAGQGGHMPLIMRIRGASFTVKPEQIIVHVTEADGRKSDLCFKLNKEATKGRENEKTKS